MILTNYDGMHLLPTPAIHAAALIIVIFNATESFFFGAKEVFDNMQHQIQQKPVTRSSINLQNNYEVSLQAYHLALRTPWIIKYLKQVYGFESRTSQDCIPNKFLLNGEVHYSYQIKKLIFISNDSIRSLDENNNMMNHITIFVQRSYGIIRNKNQFFDLV
jgi:hypothetical protein